MTLRVLATYADHGGCGEYRVKLPATVVNANNDLDIHVEVADHFDCEAFFKDNCYHIRYVSLPRGTEVVSVQRPTHAAMAGALQWLHTQRPDVGLVVELDDDLLNVPTSNVAHAGLQRRNNVLENTEWLRRSLRMADVITVSTPGLARVYGGHVPTFTVRNGVPAWMLDVPSRTITRERRTATRHSDRTIGWSGYVGTHGGDLDVTSGALAQVIGTFDRRTVSFRTVGPREGVAAALGLADDQVEASGWLSVDMYRVALAEFDIGIVPLQDNRFNRCKSTLKALEMSALGVPVVASALPEFQELQKSGLPIWLARDRLRHWLGALNQPLKMSDGELQEIAQSCREFVRRYATAEVRAPEWAVAWRTAAQIAHSRVQHPRRVEPYDRV